MHADRPRMHRPLDHYQPGNVGDLEVLELRAVSNKILSAH